MVLLDPKNTKSNTRRLMYVATTRATHNATIYTSDLETVKRQVCWNRGGKTSALESMGLLKESDIRKKDLKKHPKFTSHDERKEIKLRIDAKDVELNMSLHSKRICEQLFGAANQSLSNSQNLRYGKKGSLSIMISGSRQGSFHNFETGEKGGMIQLLISELGIDFKTALQKGHQMVNGYNSYIEPVTRENPTDLPKTGRIDAKKQAFIHSILKKSEPIEGSIAQEYLRSRGLDKNRKLKTSALSNS